MIHRIQQQIALHLLLQPMVHGILFAAQNIGEKQFIAIPVHIQRIVDRNLIFLLGTLAQIHQNLIFNATGCIRRQLDLALRAKGIHRFDEADGPDGNQILHICRAGFELLCNIYHQAQVVGNQRFTGIFLPCKDVFHHDRFLLRREGRR